MPTGTEELQPHDDAAPLLNNPLPAQGPSTLRKIFIGADGLRAGWSLLIFVLLFGGLAYCVNLTLRKLGVPQPDPHAEMSP